MSGKLLPCPILKNFNLEEQRLGKFVSLWFCWFFFPLLKADILFHEICKVGWEITT